jgi:UDP-N-acetylmuramoyl-tripeptide--D-alanyl-D-alanine ligase
LTAILMRSWPLLFWFGRLYRRTLLRRLRVIAVTGSAGKTTTTGAIVSALGERPHPWIELNESGLLACQLLRLRPTARRAAFEVAIDRPGMMAGRVGLLRPDVAVVTAVGHEHHRSLGGLEGVRDEKAVLVRTLAPTGLAVLNGDDPNVRWMADQTRARVLTFGFGPDCDVRASDYALDWPGGSHFTLHAAGQTLPVTSRLVGRHQVYPLLAAVTVALFEGRSLQTVVASLARLAPGTGRLQPLPLAGGAWLLRDDYKAPLETIDAALDLLAEIPADRKIVVLGEVSEPPGSLGLIYGRLGERLAVVATRVVVVGSNRRRYAAGAARAGLDRAAIVDARHDLGRAVALVQADLRPGDVVLVKGRDVQRLGRVALGLLGRQFRCDLQYCNAIGVGCDACPMLERGWQGRRAVMWRR